MNDLEALEQQIPTPAALHVPSKGPGVRILAPTGDIGYVPADHVDEAVAAGGKVLTPADMRELRQASFMHHALFKDRNDLPKKRKRRSIVKGGRR